jgi:hypothetical protein
MEGSHGKGSKNGTRFESVVAETNITKAVWVSPGTTPYLYGECPLSPCYFIMLTAVSGGLPP